MHDLCRKRLVRGCSEAAAWVAHERADWQKPAFQRPCCVPSLLLPKYKCFVCHVRQYVMLRSFDRSLSLRVNSLTEYSGRLRLLSGKAAAFHD
jgi:hypothetical protein